MDTKGIWIEFLNLKVGMLSVLDSTCLRGEFRVLKDKTTLKPRRHLLPHIVGDSITDQLGRETQDIIIFSWLGKTRGFVFFIAFIFSILKPCGGIIRIDHGESFTKPLELREELELFIVWLQTCLLIAFVLFLEFPKPFPCLFHLRFIGFQGKNFTFTGFLASPRDLTQLLHVARFRGGKKGHPQSASSFLEQRVPMDRDVVWVDSVGIGFAEERQKLVEELRRYGIRANCESGDPTGKASLEHILTHSIPIEVMVGDGQVHVRDIVAKHTERVRRELVCDYVKELWGAIRGRTPQNST